MFLRLWSEENRRSAAVNQAVRGGTKAASKEKALQKFYQTLKERNILPIMSVLILPSLVHFRRKHQS
jgi:polysaccharide deacetylase 2 family uncharacterized protein YibQ